MPEEHERKAEAVDTSMGYEPTDARVSGVLVFLVAMSIFVAIAGLAAFGIGRFLNARMAKEDGPKSKWATTVDIRPLGNMPSNAEMEKKMGEMVDRFPTPRVQVDDGLQDLANLHGREDLLLDHYSWADQGQGKVRIPIERAMELMAVRGLPVAPAVKQSPPMTGDNVPHIQAPLTNGFVYTGYEQEQEAATK